MKKLLLGALLFLAACAGENTAAVTSHAMSETYNLAGNTAADAMEKGLVPESAKACIKAADNIAYGYVASANKKAQEWVKAGSEEQSTIEKIVSNLSALMTDSLADIARIISTKEC